ncbi:MAG: hypothetical protein IIZ27_09585 [Solobacterium sp.]|nr:hypothetical protein [Solobacterium sp.]
MKTAKVLKPFLDLKEGVSREIGDTFSCEDERGEYLKNLTLVSLEEAPVQKKKRSVKKKEG